MILVGQFDSPFVRRVAITLQHYGIEFEHSRLSVFPTPWRWRASTRSGACPR